MSSIYIKEPQTTGKVVITTSRGEVDIELWCKECPLACRNFLQLALEGFYEGIIFHRIVPEFVIQGGDPTGTGQGGESIYGKPFRDEVHSRLRFNRRGLVGCANESRNDNTSQFFITLGPAEELNGKHTLFGKITGDTIFNVLKMGELPTDVNERPEDPPSIVKIDVLSHPFDDLKPRQEMIDAREEKKRLATKGRKRSKVKAIKNFQLMSFGDQAEEEEEEELKAAAKVGKIKSLHDAEAKNDPRLSSQALDLDEGAAPSKKKKKKETQPKSSSEPVARAPEVTEYIDHEAEFEREMRDKALRMRAGATYDGASASKDASNAELRPHTDEAHKSSNRMQVAKAEADALEAELKAQRRARLDAEKAEEAFRKEKLSAGAAFLAQQQEKYKPRGRQSKKDKASREQQTLAALQKFQSKLMRGSKPEDDPKPHDVTAAPNTKKLKLVGDDPHETEYIERLEEEAGDDKGWLAHKLADDVKHAPKGIDPAKDPYTLDIYDPRNPLNERRRKKDAKDRGRPRKSTR